MAFFCQFRNDWPPTASQTKCKKTMKGKQKAQPKRNPLLTHIWKCTGMPRSSGEMPDAGTLPAGSYIGVSGSMYMERERGAEYVYTCYG